MNKLILLIVLVLCGLLLQSCFNFADYGADKHYELKHTMEYDQPDSLFLIRHSMWYKVQSKQTENSGDVDSLEINNYTIRLYRNGTTVVYEKVVRDVDEGSGYNLHKLCFFSESSTFNFYYSVNYLDPSNLVLSIDNYRSKWKKEAWFQFSRYR